MFRNIDIGVQGKKYLAIHALMNLHAGWHEDGLVRVGLLLQGGHDAFMKHVEPIPEVILAR